MYRSAKGPNDKSINKTVVSTGGIKIKQIGLNSKICDFDRQLLSDLYLAQFFHKFYKNNVNDIKAKKPGLA